MTQPTIGFIGLGLMGGNMVECLQNSGFELTVMNSSKKAAEAVARGATGVDSAKALAAASDIVMLCVTTSDVVEGLVYGDDGLLAGMKDGSDLIDFGTSIPASTIKIGADLGELLAVLGLLGLREVEVCPGRAQLLLLARQLVAQRLLLLLRRMRASKGRDLT